VLVRKWVSQSVSKGFICTVCWVSEDRGGPGESLSHGHWSVISDSNDTDQRLGPTASSYKSFLWPTVLLNATVEGWRSENGGWESSHLFQCH